MTDPLEHVSVDDREAERLRGELAIDAAGIGTFDWDLVTGRLDWDARLVELFGYDADDLRRARSTASTTRLHPDDRDRHHGRCRPRSTPAATSTPSSASCLPTGETRWVPRRGRALCRRRRHRRRGCWAPPTTPPPSGTAELRVARVLEAMKSAFFSLDRDWRFTYVNAEAEQLLLRTREELLGGSIWELFPAAVGSDFEEQLPRAPWPPASRCPSRPTTRRPWTPGTRCGPGRAPTGCRCTSSTSPRRRREEQRGGARPPRGSRCWPR